MRSVLSTVLAGITLIGCFVKIYHLHRPRITAPLLLVVFYVAAVQSLLMMLKWVYFRTIIIHFVAIYLQVNEFLILCVHYGKLMLKVLHKEAHVTKYVSVSVERVTSRHVISSEPVCLGISTLLPASPFFTSPGSCATL